MKSESVVRQTPQKINETVLAYHSQVRAYYSGLASKYKSLANQTCEDAYSNLLRQHLTECRSVMEVGCGSSDLLGHLKAIRSVGCDLTLTMLSKREKNTETLVAGAGEQLPFQDASFDGVYLINVLEHVADVETVISECARVLQKNGLWLTVTPNGNWEFWLNLVEHLRLKIPEGPHKFLTQEKLRAAASKCFEIKEHKTFLVFPAGSVALANYVDRITFAENLGLGFFQYLVARKL